MQDMVGRPTAAILSPTVMCTTLAATHPNSVEQAAMALRTPLGMNRLGSGRDKEVDPPPLVHGNRIHVYLCNLILQECNEQPLLHRMCLGKCSNSLCVEKPMHVQKPPE